METRISTQPNTPSPATPSEPGVGLPAAEPPRNTARPAPPKVLGPSPELQSLVSAYLSESTVSATNRLLSRGEEGAQALLAVAINRNAPLEHRLLSLDALAQFSGKTSEAQIRLISSIASQPSEDGAVVKAALETLQSLGDIRAERELALLAGKGGRLAEAAIEQLKHVGGFFGKVQVRPQGIAHQLLELYQKGDPQTRSKLITRITELKDPTAIQLVSQALIDPHHTPSEKVKIIRVVLDSSPEHARKFLPTLSELLSAPSTNPAVRFEALKASTRIARHFGITSDQPDVPSLREVAASSGDPLQRNARIATAFIDGDVRGIASLARSPGIDSSFLSYVLGRLSTLPESAKPSFRELAREPTTPQEVRIAAANALGRSGPDGREEGASLISIMLKEQLSEKDRIEVLQQLVDLSPTRGIEELKYSLNHGVITPEGAAIVLEGRNSPIDPSITTPLYLELLKKLPPDSPSTSSVITALGDSGDTSVIPVLRALPRELVSSDTVLTALVRLGDKKSVDELVSSLTGTIGDSDDYLSSLAYSSHPHAAGTLAVQLQNVDDFEGRTSRLRVLEGLTPSEKRAFGERLMKAAVAETDPKKSSFLRSYGEAIVTGVTELGIESPFRYPPEFLISAVRERRSPAPDGRPLAIVITAREDNNGFLNRKTRDFTELSRAGFRVMLYEVATDTELAQSLQKGTAQGQKADLIMFYGHGSKNSLALGARDPRLVRSNASLHNDPGALSPADEPLLRKASDTLRPGGEIIAVSCSLGEGGRGADNIASLLRRVFPQAKEGGIYTSTDDTAWNVLQFTPSGAKIRFDVDGLQSKALPKHSLASNRA